MWTQAHRGESHVKREAETGEMRLQGEEHRGLLAAIRSYKRQGKILPSRLQRDHGPAGILVADF